MRIHYIQHVPFEDLGSIAIWAATKNAQISCTRLFKEEPLPELTDFDWLIVMGGPMNIYEEDIYPWLKREKIFIGEAISHGKKVLGVCLGAQLIADVLGAKVYANNEKEIGWFPIKASSNLTDKTLRDIFDSDMEVMHWHGDTFTIPAGAIRLAENEVCQNQGFIYKKNVLALQFHLETTAASLARLINNFKDELVAGRYIQNADDMLAMQERFARINVAMNTLLNYFLVDENGNSK